MWTFKNEYLKLILKPPKVNGFLVGRRGGGGGGGGRARDLSSARSVKFYDIDEGPCTLMKTPAYATWN